jgi:hypothetical protein
LVFGDGEAAMTMLAAGLAQRESPEFAWADCARSTARWELPVRTLATNGSGTLRPEAVEPRDLEPHAIRPGAIREMVRLPAGGDRVRDRVLEFLRLPDLLQRLVASGAAGISPSPIVLTNVDRLPDDIVRTSLEDPRTHEALRREGVPLLVTYRGEASPGLRHPFDRVVRVTQGSAPAWTDASVQPERLHHGEPLLGGTVREFWRRQGLDPVLLDISPAP